MRYYFASMEGVTDSVYRRLHHQFFGGVDNYFMPFLSPTIHRTLSHKEDRELPNADTVPFRAVPQVLTKIPPDFLWAAAVCRDRGYDEVNLNVGCPSGTVVAKGKGAGMLADPGALDRFLDEIFSDAKKAGISVLDSHSILKENSDKYIFYKTDHHWTTLGAKLVFSEYMNLLGVTPSDFSVYDYKSVSDFYGTSFYKCKLFSATADTINYYDIPVQSIEFDGETSDSLHDVEKFNTTDAYSGFIHGNNGITRIVSDCPDAEGSCLLVKDSYGNSFAPFLLTEFKEVVVVDLRYIPKKMSELMSANDFDQVLILYSFSNFSNDINLSKLTF